MQYILSFLAGSLYYLMFYFIGFTHYIVLFIGATLIGICTFGYLIERRYEE